MTYPTFQSIHKTPKIKVFIEPISEIVTERNINNPSFISSEENNQLLFFIDSTAKAKKSISLDGLTAINTINGLLAFSKKAFIGELQGLFARLKKIIALYDEEEDQPISTDSLKSLLIFILNIPFKFKKPTLTLNESGTFQLNWKLDNSNIITLRFKSENNVDYVIFKPSQHNLRPIILHGNMNILDFMEYLKELNLYRVMKGLS